MAVWKNNKKYDDDSDVAKKHYAIVASHSGGPSAVQNSGGSGSKGGSKPSYDPQTEADLLQRAQAKYNTDDMYGYYNNQGQYVGFLQDATDGGGMNTTDTFFQGGPLSTLLNVAKVRPSGMSREKNEAGEFIVPRADIGFRDAADLTDRGGPQHSGGKFQGGGKISAIANTLDNLSGREPDKRVRRERTGEYDFGFYIPTNYSQPERESSKKKQLLQFLMGQ